MISRSDSEVVKTRPEKRRHKSSRANEEYSNSRYAVTRRSGGKFSKLTPVFSKDEKYVFLCSNAQARVYSATTGELVRALTHSKSHKSPIVAMLAHPTNEYRLITVSLEGLVLTWDWTDGSLIRTELLAATQVVSAILVGSTLLWTDGKTIHMSNDFPVLKHTHQVSQLSICVGLATNKEQIFAYGDRSIMIFRLKPSGTTTDHEYLTLPATLTSFAVSNDNIAYSDASGSIYAHTIQPFSKNKEVTPRKFHWHSTAVSTLQFALNGDYLLSGGEEGVLVLWQMSTSAKQFLPRVARRIEAIGVSNTSKLYALKLDDNIVKLVTATDLSLQAEVVGPRYTTGKMSATVDGDNIVMCNGADAQVWNVPTGRTAIRLPITALNFGGHTRDHFRANESSVQDCAVHGEWLGTIDSWCTPKEEAVDLGQTKPRDEVYLKFWKWNGTSYDLITRIDSPHGEFRVTQLIAARDGSFFTGGDDAAIKIWRPKPVKKDMIGGGTEVVGTTWSCRRVIKLTRSQGSCRMALSSDCTVLALCVRDQVFLIDVVSGTLRSCMSTLTAGRVSNVGIVKSSLVVVGFKKLVVWDLLSTSVTYALRIPEATTELHLSCGGQTFALSTIEQSKHKSTAKIFVFEPHSAKPIFREKGSRTLALIWSPRHGYIQVTADLELVHISSLATPRQSVAANTVAPLASSGISSIYKEAKEVKVSTGNQAIEGMQEMVLTTQSVTRIFDDSIKTLESKFEDLAALVLGKPKKSWD